MTGKPTYDPDAFRQFEHEGWSEVAETYQASFGALTRQAIDPLLEAVGAGPGVRLLEVACGPGELAGEAARLGCETTGLDFAAPMVADARRRQPGVTFQEGDAEALPFEEGSFDAVVCAFGMLHFPHPEWAVAEAFRTLRPGGQYAFSAWCPPERSPFFKLIYETFKVHAEFAEPVPVGTDIFQYGHPTVCEQALQAAGFTEVTVREWPVTAHFDGPEGILEMIERGMARTKGTLRRLTEASRRRIAGVIHDGAAAYPRDGGIQIPAPATVAVGRKP